jgi:hypothetical protein
VGWVNLNVYGEQLKQHLLSKGVVDVNGCWLWTGKIEHYGYGVIWVQGKEKKVHRVSYELFIGEVPEGLVLDHLCRVRRCFNPSHLEPVTRGENVRRGDLKTNNHCRLKTKCPAGHLYDEENTRVSPSGKRICRACHRLREAKRRTQNGV